MSGARSRGASRVPAIARELRGDPKENELCYLITGPLRDLAGPARSVRIAVGSISIKGILRCSAKNTDEVMKFLETDEAKKRTGARKLRAALSTWDNEKLIVTEPSGPASFQVDVAKLPSDNEWLAFLVLGAKPSDRVGPFITTLHDLSDKSACVIWMLADLR